MHAVVLLALRRLDPSILAESRQMLFVITFELGQDGTQVGEWIRTQLSVDRSYERFVEPADVLQVFDLFVVA